MVSPEEPHGLSAAEAAARLEAYGPNAVAVTRRHPSRMFLSKLGGAVPFMLEGALGLELVLGKWIEAVIIATLLVFNAVLSFVQESRANAALDALRARLHVVARALRDGKWGTVPAERVVPGDVLRLRAGDVVPADLRVLDGTVLVDASAITGESVPVDLARDAAAYAGALVKRGEATGIVVATGARTYSGKAVEIVRTAGARGHLQELMGAIVRYLLLLDAALIAVVIGYTLARRLGVLEVLPFALTLLIASVPVALPATFTLATALASLGLAARGVLVTRLAAIHDAASMSVLCSDKTGTLTENRLSLARVIPFAATEAEVLELAALASDPATQDPIDLAILERAGASSTMERLSFVPFDPATKRSAAVVRSEEGEVEVVKGAPAVLSALAKSPPDVGVEVERLAENGLRVIAVAAGPRGALRLVGLLALTDPVRPESKDTITRLSELGIRVVMVTGDGEATAASVARELGLRGHTGTRKDIEARGRSFDVFAGVFPEDKFALVRSLQREGAIVGMTGDGVNDAPALKQAEVGIAVMSATDAARSAASLVLTRPGLSAAIELIEEGRRVYQRMLTWTLNKLVKTFEISLLLTVGFVSTGLFLTTPRHILLLIFTNDFVTMSLASDRVSFSNRPDRWSVRPLVVIGATMAAGWLAFTYGVIRVGRDVLHLNVPELQTLVFLTLVFTGQASIYLLRERGRVWTSRPGGWMLIASALDVVVVSVLATQGILIAPVAPVVVLALLASVVGHGVLLDQLKIRLTKRVR